MEFPKHLIVWVDSLSTELPFHLHILHQGAMSHVDPKVNYECCSEVRGWDDDRQGVWNRNGDTLVPYVWPYFGGISPYMGLKRRPYIR